MSAANWRKIKTPSQAKALIRHNSVECRIETNHSNPDIDTGRTSLNLSFDGLSYAERCAKYDNRVTQCKANMARVRSDAVTLIGLNVKLPPGLTYADYDVQCRWCKRCYDTIVDFVGIENIVSATADFDEIHRFINAETGQEELSRPEVDVKFVPEIDGKLCAKRWETPANMQLLNTKIENMTQSEFGIGFMTGKIPGKRSTESIKAQSQRMETEKLLETRARKLEVYRAELVAQRQKLANEINYFLECRSATLAAMEDTDTSREQYMRQLRFSDGTTAEERYKQYRNRQRAEMAVTEQKLFAIADAYNQQKSGGGCNEQEKTQRRYRGGDTT